MPASSFRDHVIICGLGRIGYRVVQEFLDIGQPIVIIERDEHGSFNDFARSRDVPLLIGDARQPDKLESAGIAGCLSMIIVTDDDLTNLDIALTARTVRDDVHVVLRVFNDTLARKLEGSFGIRTVFSTSAIAAPTVAAAALMRGVRHALHVGDRLLSTIELTVAAGSTLVGETVGTLEQRLNVSAIELYTAAGNELRPESDHRVAAEERIVVVGELDMLRRLRDLNHTPGAADDPQLATAGSRSRQGGRADQSQPGLRSTLVPLARQARRLAQANMRDADLLLRESFGPLGAFLTLLLLVTWALALGYRDPADGSRATWAESFYCALMMAGFQPTLDLPREPLVQLVFFTWPFLSLYLLARGALSFVLLLLDKRNRRDAWNMALATTYREHLIVCGLGRIGYRVVQEFRELGYEVVAIEQQAGAEFNEAIRATGVPVLIGDIRQEELLRTAGVAHCLALVVVSDDDLANLDVALTAREIRSDVHVVVRVFNDALADKLEGSFGIRTAFSISALAAPTLAAAALMRGVRHALHVGNRLLSTIELTIQRGSRLDGRFIRRVEHDQNIAVIELRSGGSGESDLRPKPDHRLGADDLIVVVGELHDLSLLRDLNNESEDDPMGRNREAVLRRLLRRSPVTERLDVQS